MESASREADHRETAEPRETDGTIEELFIIDCVIKESKSRKIFDHRITVSFIELLVVTVTKRCSLLLRFQT